MKFKAWISYDLRYTFLFHEIPGEILTNILFFWQNLMYVIWCGLLVRHIKRCILSKAGKFCISSLTVVTLPTFIRKADYDFQSLCLPQTIIIWDHLLSTLIQSQFHLCWNVKDQIAKIMPRDQTSLKVKIVRCWYGRQYNTKTVYIKYKWALKLSCAVIM